MSVKSIRRAHLQLNPDRFAGKKFDSKLLPIGTVVEGSWRDKKGRLRRWAGQVGPSGKVIMKKFL